MVFPPGTRWRAGRASADHLAIGAKWGTPPLDARAFLRAYVTLYRGDAPVSVCYLTVR
jgi:hypothetical protein